jgi:hypothetical protein
MKVTMKTCFALSAVGVIQIPELIVENKFITLFLGGKPK